MKQVTGNFKTAFIAVTSLFFMWGFITVLVDALIPRLKEVFELQYYQASLVQFAWFMAYGLVAIPAGMLLTRIGYKKGIVVGLATAGLGCMLFYPAAELRVFGLFLTALFVLASGITMLQVAANPYIAVLGPPSGAASRLNLAQAFNSLGTTIAPMVSAAYLLGDQIMGKDAIAAMDEAQKQAYYASEAESVQMPFLVVAGFFALLAVFMSISHLPKILSGERKTISEYFKVLRHKRLRFGVLGIFVYVGAEVAIGSFLTNYFLNLGLAEAVLRNPTMNHLASSITSVFSGKSIGDLDEKGVVGAFLIFYWGSAMIGRFVGAWLTSRFRPAHVLRVFAFGAIALVLLSISTSGFLAMFSILLVGFFNSIMFPTIFTLSLDGLGEETPEASGVLVTSIVGGAFIPMIVGVTIDSWNFGIAFFIPVVCYLTIVMFARYASRDRV
ncbi:MAG: L-fucose:H+ symporter permease [Cryomorphaceae bacterium]|nr:L-fucose:H+ symporter permease [Cryomorphaceae bacterium]